MLRSNLAVSLIIAWTAAAPADTVELSGGGHLSGNVKRQEKSVIVQVDDDIHVAVPASRVQRVVDSDQLRRYRDLASRAGDDPERHYQLAIWCLKDDNVPGEKQHYKRYHMRRAVELDPNHVKARASLGYTRDNGKWILTSELRRQRGMITVSGGKWALPEAAAIEESREEADKAAKQWIREVTRLTKSVFRNSKNAGESLEKLKSIDDPMAAAAIAEQLEDSRHKNTQSQQMRLLWVDLLGRFRTIVAVQALVKAGVDEVDETVREAALVKLQEFGAGSAVATYMPMLKDNDNRRVNRAARALTYFPDAELALDYVDALVTEHKQIIQPGPGLQAGFSGDGGGGLSTGSKPIVRTHVRENPAVLSLLKTIEPDASYGYDENAWRLHFARLRTAFSGDLRRDP